MSHAPTAIRWIPRDSVRHVTVRPAWLRTAAAYLLPTLATGAGCYLALATAARVLAALVAPDLRPH